jgi:tetratricopeptide (TPR) repeat protein
MHAVFWILFLSIPFHGDLSVRIAEMTQAIQSHPKNGLLYMQRGELYFQHEQPDSALIDYRTALKNGLDTSLIHVLMAEAFLANGENEEGLSSVGEFLALEPNNLKGIHTRGKLLEASGKLKDAITDFEFVLQKADNPRPQDYTDLAELYLKSDANDVNRAIGILRQGIEKLGKIISLQMRIYDLEKKRQNFAAAHRLLDEMMEPLSRKERLMVEKAELFLLERKTVEAAESLVDAENAIASLPPRFQNIGATDQLKKRIAELKQQL